MKINSTRHFSYGIIPLSSQVSSIKVRNSKPVRLVLEAANEQEEKKRRAIAFREATEEEKKALQIVSLHRAGIYFYFEAHFKCSDR